MPQLDVATFPPQLFWLAVTFIVLYILMKVWALPQVGSAIEQRRRRLDEDLGRAAQMKAEAEAVFAAYEKALAAARVEAQSTIRAQSERLAAEAAERQRERTEALARQIAEAERRIAEAKQQALSEVRGIAVEVARSVTEKLIGAPADEQNVAAAVDRAMAERAA